MTEWLTTRERLHTWLPEDDHELFAGTLPPSSIIPTTTLMRSLRPDMDLIEADIFRLFQHSFNVRIMLHTVAEGDEGDKVFKGGTSACEVDSNPVAIQRQSDRLVVLQTLRLPRRALMNALRLGAIDVMGTTPWGEMSLMYKLVHPVSHGDSGVRLVDPARLTTDGVYANIYFEVLEDGRNEGIAGEMWSLSRTPAIVENTVADWGTKKRRRVLELT